MADDAPQIPEAFVRADQLIRELTSDPTLGAQVRAKVKERFSDVSFIEDRIDPAVATLQARLDEEAAARRALEATIAERDQKAADAARANDMQAALSKARADYRLTDEGFDLMVQRMKDTGNFTDAEAAAAWAASKNPVVKAPSTAYLGPQNVNFFGAAEYNEDMKLLHKDPSGLFIDNEMNKFLADPDQYTRDAGFAA